MKKPDSGKDLLSFLAEAVTPFHAVSVLEQKLVAGGSRRDSGGKNGHLTRDDASIIAWRRGGKKPQRLVIWASHTDSPVLKLRPESLFAKNNFHQSGVEVYGGVLLHTWLDRDLACAGRLVRENSKGALETSLFRIREPLFRIPSLAIHLNPEVNSSGLQLNKQTQMMPVVSTSTKKTLRGIVSDAANVPEKEILSAEILLCDAQPPALGGLEEEFIFSGRLDNLAMCHAGLLAFQQAELPEDTMAVFAAFHHEEVGSRSHLGAASAFFGRTLEELLGGREELLRVSEKALLVSADMAHATHPHHPAKHDEEYPVKIGGGPVLKINSNQNYATDLIGQAIFEKLVVREKLPHQKYVHRNDIGCGSTIGPILAASLGFRTLDIGNPMLSMHSVREMAGRADQQAMVRLGQLLFAETGF